MALHFISSPLPVKLEFLFLLKVLDFPVKIAETSENRDVWWWTFHGKYGDDHLALATELSSATLPVV